MRLSTKSRYGLRALFDIAYHALNRPVQIQDIARRQDISPRYLEQIFQSLKRAGIIKSKRGPQGGYLIARPLTDVTVKDIVKATEGDLLLVDCSPVNRKRSKKACSFDGTCVTQMVWTEASHRLEELFAEVSLATLCDRGHSMGLKLDDDLKAERKSGRKSIK